MSESIFGKLKTMVTGAAHDALDKHEDVGATARQTVRELEEQISKAEDSLAETMAEHNVRVSHRDTAQVDVARFAGYAQQAVTKGNDELARSALQDKQAATAKLNKIQAEIDKFQPLIDKQREGVATLQKKLKDIQDQVGNLETRMVIAEAEDRTATILGGIGDGASAAKTFERLEGKVAHQEGLAAAKSELAIGKIGSGEDKYAGLGDPTVPSVDDELAALKASHAQPA
jgi:phage shock protein A